MGFEANGNSVKIIAFMAVIAMMATSSYLILSDQNETDAREVEDVSISLKNNNCSSTSRTSTSGEGEYRVKVVTFTVTPSSKYFMPEDLQYEPRNGLTVEYYPNKTMTGGTVTVTVDKGYAESYSSASVTITCIKGVTIKFDITPKVTTISDMYVSSSIAQTVTLPEVKGYEYPSKVELSSTGRSISVNSSHKFTIPVSSLYPNTTLTVSVSYIAQEFTVDTSGVGKGLTCTVTGTPIYGQTMTITLTAKEGYDLPEANKVTVKNGSSTVSVSSNYGGKITISKVEGNMSVTAVGTAKVFKIQYLLPNGVNEIRNYADSYYSYTYDIEKALPNYLPSGITYSDGKSTHHTDEMVFDGLFDSSGKKITSLPAGTIGDQKVYVRAHDDMSLVDHGFEQLILIMMGVGALAMAVTLIIGRK